MACVVVDHFLVSCMHTEGSKLSLFTLDGNSNIKICLRGICVPPHGSYYITCLV